LELPRKTVGKISKHVEQDSNQSTIKTLPLFPLVIVLKRYSTKGLSENLLSHCIKRVRFLYLVYIWKFHPIQEIPEIYFSQKEKSTLDFHSTFFR
jgi:hypothetical protein